MIICIIVFMVNKDGVGYFSFITGKDYDFSRL